MSLLSRLEPKLGRFAVPNLTLVLIFGQVLLYVADQAKVANGPDVLERLKLYPEKVLAGEFWRVITFLFDPPSTNLIFAFMFWYLFYMFGSTLEATWGEFRYNVYLLIGYVASVAASFALYFSGHDPGMPASSGFLYGTVFLAFARLYPDFVLQIFFIFPVQVRWLALLTWIGYGIAFVVGDWMVRTMIVASVANYLLFFGRDVWQHVRYSHRRMRFQSRAAQTPKRMSHKCQTCGLTSEESPHMAFRYCSKCEGNCCYCAGHMHNHEHVVATAESAAGEKQAR